MSKEALKLAVSVLKGAQEYKRGHTTFVDAVEELEEALAEQPAQALPFGVGGGLVAIKTLLSRDPCGHANTAIQMIDAILAEQPAQQDIPDLIAREFGVSRGTAYDMMREALAGQPAQQEPVARIAELEETVRHLNHTLREATEAPTFMGEPVSAEPAARIKGVDEYGPMLDWYTHWVNFPVGTNLYTSPQPAQRTWIDLTDDELRQVWYDDAPVEGGTYIDKLRQVEAKSREKNT